MRKYPHKPNEKQLIARLEIERRQYQQDLADLSRFEADWKAPFFEGLCESVQGMAGIEYALEYPLDQVIERLSRAAEYAYKVVRFGGILDPDLYETYLALAVLNDHDDLRRRLQLYTRQQYTNPNIEYDDISYLAAEGMGMLSAGDLKGAGAICGVGLQRIISRGTPNVLSNEAVEPLLQLVEAIASRNAAKLIGAIREREREHVKKYSRRNAPEGLLDIIGLGLLKLGKGFGLTIPATNVYLPLELVS